MPTSTVINSHCRLCQEHCWGDCPGQKIENFLTLEQIADGLGPPHGSEPLGRRPADKKPSCFRLAENRDGDFDPVTGDLLPNEHEPILQG